jgi:hypothetical protein
MFLKSTPCVLTRRVLAWFSAAVPAERLTRKEPAMNSYVEIQIQSPADGAGFVAQWYAGGERSGQAFPLCTIGELLFFAFFAEAPMVIPDDATRAMLCERGYSALRSAR